MAVLPDLPLVLISGNFESSRPGSVSLAAKLTPRK